MESYAGFRPHAALWFVPFADPFARRRRHGGFSRALPRVQGHSFGLDASTPQSCQSDQKPSSLPAHEAAKESTLRSAEVAGFMSAEAVRLVIEQSTARGAGLLALVMLAHESKDRTAYPQASIIMERWARRCRCARRSMIDTVQKLIQSGKLFVVEPAKGQLPPVYEIPVRGVQVSTHLDVQVSAPLNREDPKGDSLARAL